MDIEQLMIKNIWEERELFPLSKAIYSCKKCKSYSVEQDAYNLLRKKFKDYQNKYSGYLNYYLASRYSGEPKYIFIYVDFNCSSCNEKHKAFFYSRFKESYFPENEKEFFLADIKDSNLEENIDGVYNRNTCQEFMKKMLMRWYILKNITYIVFPFIGNSYQTAEQRLELLGDFLSPLHPYKTLWVTRSETLSQIKTDLNKDLGDGAYEILEKKNKIHPVINSAFKKRDFHAKFYCGINEHNVEVLTGSHNLHGGNSMENIMFKNYEMDRFIDRYMMQINVAPILPQNKTKTEVLIFDRESSAKIDSFINNATDLLQKYNT